MKNEELRCPVCKMYFFDEVGKYEICPICHFEDDPIQRKDHDYKGGANKQSINEAIKEYAKEK